MRKILKHFNSIWKNAEERNKKEPHRFHQLFEQRFAKDDPKKRYVTVGIYDSVTKKYVLFDTIGLVANFRFNSKSIPPEFVEMEKMVAV